MTMPMTELSRAPISIWSILAASAGNMLACYDFSIYALFAIYIAEDFFPGGTAGVEH